MHQFHIEDMTCKHCEASVTKAVKQLDPQAEVQIDLLKHEARVISGLDRKSVV